NTKLTIPRPWRRRLRRLDFGYLHTILHVNKKRILASHISSLLILINATIFPAETFSMSLMLFTTFKYSCHIWSTASSFGLPRTRGMWSCWRESSAGLRG
uniref:Uncharacterized protein n=1 Tax=Nothoprocta perdicaria TaxID=30464 RepID=A0A8C6ZRK9_NOTPE